MNEGRSIFSQLTGHLPHKPFARCVQRYQRERYVLDLLPIEAGSFYLLDRGYLDFARLHPLSQQAALTSTRTKKQHLLSSPLLLAGGQEQTPALRSDHCVDRLLCTSRLPGQTALDQVRRFRCRKNPALPHLRIKAFFGTSENAVKTQIRIIVSVYVLVAILKKRLHPEHVSLYTILQTLSVSLFEKKPFYRPWPPSMFRNLQGVSGNQLE